LPGASRADRRDNTIDNDRTDQVAFALWQARSPSGPLFRLSATQGERPRDELRPELTGDNGGHPTERAGSATVVTPDESQTG
jgi:hypothetical protein